MTLPPRALHVLADLKRSLLARPVLPEASTTGHMAPANGPEAGQEPAQVPARALAPAPKQQTMRHARRSKAETFSRYCRRREFFTPVFGRD